MVGAHAAAQSSLILRPARLPPAVVDAILADIVAGIYPPGTFLPKEQELVELFGVSRTVIREATTLLQEKGILTVQQGRGTTVLGRDSWNLLDPAVIEAIVEHDGPLSSFEQELVALRATLESEVAAIAAGRATEDNYEELRQLIAEMESKLNDRSAYLEADRRFHDAIERASGQLVARRVLGIVHRWTVFPDIDDADDLLKQSMDEHRAIFEALAARDGAMASSLVHSHVTGSYNRVRERRAIESDQQA